MRNPIPTGGDAYVELVATDRNAKADVFTASERQTAKSHTIYRLLLGPI
jgi:hypothetical protein